VGAEAWQRLAEQPVAAPPSRKIVLVGVCRRPKTPLLNAAGPIVLHKITCVEFIPYASLLVSLSAN
jgi:hypothetical protein